MSIIYKNHTNQYLFKAFILEHLDKLNISVTLCFNAVINPIDGAHAVKKWHNSMAKAAYGSHYKRYQREDRVTGLYLPEICPSTAFTTSEGNKGFLHYHGSLRINKHVDKVIEIAEETWAVCALEQINNLRANADPTMEFGTENAGRRWSNYCTKNIKYDKVTLTPLLQNHFILL